MKALIALLGETATGKSDVAIYLCQRLRGEVLSLDSMQIYRKLTVGTGVVPPGDRRGVPHHLLEIAELDQPFSVGDFLSHYRDALDKVRSRDAWPVLTVGTGLYLKGVLFGIFEGPGKEERVRSRLRQEIESVGTDMLHDRLSRLDPEAARRIGRKDALRIIRALEVLEITGRPISQWQRQWDRPSAEAFLVGLRREREDLRERVSLRIERMLSLGWIEEVQGLLDRGLGDAIDSKGPIGYPELKAYLRGETSLDEAKMKIFHRTLQLAKKQRTWFRSMPHVHWLQVARDRSYAEIAQDVFDCIDREGAFHG